MMTKNLKTVAIGIGFTFIFSVNYISEKYVLLVYIAVMAFLISVAYFDIRNEFKINRENAIAKLKSRGMLAVLVISLCLISYFYFDKIYTIE